MYPGVLLKGTLKQRSAEDLSNDAHFLYISICCVYSFELHQQVDAIQMGIHNVCFYKEVNKKYTGYNLKTTVWLDCALMGVCAVIR